MQSAAEQAPTHQGAPAGGLTSHPGSLRPTEIPEGPNISEYCKRQACWAAVSNLEIGLGVDLKRSTVDRKEAGQRKREALAGKRLDDEVEFDVLLVS